MSSPSGSDDLDLPWAQLALAAVPVACVTYALPSAVALAHDGTVGLPVGPAILGTFRIVAWNRWSSPATAYPDRIAGHMPDALWWWASGALVVAMLVVLAGLLWWRLEPLTAGARLGRRRYDPRGSRQRTWARRRDLRDLTRASRRTAGFSIGTAAGRQLFAAPESHLAVVAPTRSGKTTRCVIPWLLEHDGPAIVTSTKSDVLDVTRDWRARHGRVQVFDPFGESSSGWTPILGCKDWAHALSQAHWLADSAADGDSEIAAYWRGEAAKLLAPLLHAAAISDRGIEHILRWVDGQVRDEPCSILRRDGNREAHFQLTAVLDLDPRNRGTTYMSAGSLLAAYRYPQVRRSHGPAISVSSFLDGAPNTLYLVASVRQQRLLAPVIVGMLNSMLHGAMERPRDTTLRVLLDEAANIAPLRDLPTHLSQAAGYGIRIASIWQSVSQIEQRYRHDADTVLANSNSKLFMGPVTDEATRRYLVNVLGEIQVETTIVSVGARGDQRTKSTAKRMRSAASAQDLQQLRQDRAILIDGANVPAVVALRPWWERRAVRRRAISA